MSLSQRQIDAAVAVLVAKTPMDYVTAREVVFDVLGAVGGTDGLSPAQGSLLDDPSANVPTVVRRGDPETSRQAARSNEPRNGNQRERVLRFLEERYSFNSVGGEPPSPEWGVTASHVETALALPSSSVSKRLGELEQAGYVRRTAATARSVRGGAASLYRPTIHGLKWCREHPVAGLRASGSVSHPGA
jgi:DNA-binding transcriptional ArsR family regulator